jgi:DNA-binding transcriptional ArsR family regulator
MSMTPGLDVLGDRNRRLLLALLAVEQELCVCELEAAAALAQPVVSRQLALLQAAGWLAARREGRRVYYRIASIPEWASTLLSAYAAGGVPTTDLAAARSRLLRFDRRPVRLTRKAS